MPHKGTPTFYGLKPMKDRMPHKGTPIHYALKRVWSRMHSSLQLVLILLAVAVLVAAVARTLRLPTMLGYLVTGIAIGPFALGWIPDSEEERYLAEFGVVFLMFSIGLEFSLPRLMSMRMTVFGFGGAQVVFTIAFAALIAWLLDLSLLAAVALGGIISMSSTAIVSKLLAERLEIQTPHGRQIFGALLFQDLAVVPLLILIPAFAKDADDMALELGLAMLKAVAVLGFLLFVGQRIMRPWFQWVASHKSPELFTLNLLLFTLGLAFLTESAGLSLALGAFLAGMLISETEYRYQVEDDIKPFRDVLLGLFFVTIGMRLDLMQVMLNWGDVLLLVAAIVVGKAALVAGLAMAFGSSRPTAVRTALGLAQAGEFGFVLLAQAADLKLLGAEITQPVLAAMVLSMLVAPLLINRMDTLTRLIAGSEWAGRAKEVHDIAVQTFGKARHVIVCGYGRSGQNLARLLEALTPNIDTSVPLSASDITNRISAMLDQGDNQAALDIIQKREIQLADANSIGTDVQLMFLHGRALSALGRHNEAISMYMDMTTRFPELPEPWNNLAAEYVRQGKVEMARDALQMALAAAPDYAVARQNMGEVQLMLAEQSFSKAATHGASGAKARALGTAQLLKR